MTSLAILLAAPALCTLTVTIIAALTWPRGSADGAALVGVSILIPARDEAENIEAALRAACAQPAGEILVYDDQSRDATPRIVEQIAEADPRVRLVRGTTLPDGWVGKTFACARLAEEASGAWLVYQDADVRLEPGALARLGSIAAAYRADLVTAVPRQEVRTWLERLLVPLLHVIYTSWLPAPLVWSSRDERMLMANGQLLAVRRDALRAAGGWSKIRHELVDDMALCRAVKRSGARVVFADGHAIASCRMYRSASEVWQGFTKNLFEGLGESSALLGVAIALHLWAFVLPIVALVLGVVLDAPTLVAGGAIGTCANVAQRAWLTLRHAQPALGALLQPIAVLVLVALALDSWRTHASGRVRWRGRRYPARSARTV